MVNKFFLIACFVLCINAFSVSIGTFNIEFFTTDSEKESYYTEEDLKCLADKILASNASVLALQEIDCEESLDMLCSTMKGWKYFISETDWIQDLAFIWNERKIELCSIPEVHFKNLTFSLNRKKPLFHRAPISAVFRDREAGYSFTLVNVHFKSSRISNRSRYGRNMFENIAKRREQFQHVEKLVQALGRENTIVAGDFNCTTGIPDSNVISLRALERGYSYDSRATNLDLVGVYRLGPMFDPSNITVREIESAIPWRSGKKQHPDHDLIVLDLSGRGPAVKTNKIKIKYSKETYTIPDHADSKFLGKMLVYAAADGNLDKARELISAGASLFEKTRDGYSPLMLAVMSGNSHLVRLLLSKGAEAEHTAKDGRTAISIASDLGQALILELIMQHS